MNGTSECRFTDRKHEPLRKESEMKKLALCLLTLVLAIPSFADDLGMGIKNAEPVDTWSGITSNTAEIYGFYTAFTVSAPTVTQNTGDWSTTRTQWLADGTSQTLTRTMIFNWMELTNLTTRTLYVSVNATHQSLVSGGLRTIINETTPTLNTTIYQFRLDPYTTALPFRMQLDGDSNPDLFPIQNLGIYAYDSSSDFFTSATFQSEVTSTTLVIRGR